MTTTTRQSEPKAPAGATGLIVMLLSATFVMTLNETLMSVALPTLMKDLGLSATTGQWLTTGYLLVMAILIPTTGFLFKRFPLRSIFVAAMGAFILGTLAGALASGFPLLLVGRILQAGGTAVMLPLGLTAVMNLVPAERRGRIMGSASIVIAAAPAIGPTVSGLILQTLSWRWLFWLVLPFAVLCTVVGTARMRNFTSPSKVKIDLLSVVLSALSFGGLVYGLSSIGESHGGALISPWLALGIGLAALAVFILRQRALQRGDRALLDLRPLGSSAFVVPFVTIAAVMMALFGTIIVLPLYLQNVLHLGTLTVGMATLPGGLVMAAMGPLVGRLFDRYGPRPLVIPGALLVSATFWIMTATFDEHTSFGYIVFVQTLLMAGVGVMLTPMMTTALGSVRRDLYSHGSAIVSTVQQLASAAGSALFVTVMTQQSSPSAGQESAMADGVHSAFLCGGFISLVAVVLALFIRRPVAPSQDEAADAEPLVPLH
ncbi:MDR family MFS transporter [Amycolatopsis jejuensis]|uniref:MDR family MFS transporter n=1 Tax=Amycolatopsis jejuensis TaxID=330084 RepID=UPI001FDF25C9|nr:MDR family MFS transporter [Amycolatopsis jejuensis]